MRNERHEWTARSDTILKLPNAEWRAKNEDGVTISLVRRDDLDNSMKMKRDMDESNRGYI